MKFYRIICILLAVSLVLSVYMVSSRSVMFDENFYKKEFLKNDAYSSFEDPDSIGLSVISFLKGSEKLPSIFTKDEALHMVDVRDLVAKGNNLLLFLFAANIILLSVLLFSSQSKRKSLKKVLVYSGSAIIILPLISIIFSFEKLFTGFHHLFFPQGNWMFDINSNLIMLFPEQFFYDAFISIMIRSVLIGILLIIIGFFSSKISSN